MTKGPDAMENSIDEFKKSVPDWLSWFPTFYCIPANRDLRENSIPADAIHRNGEWEDIAKDYAMAEWVRAVKPVETIKIHDGAIVPAIYQGISKLREHQCEPTVLCGYPNWIADIENDPMAIKVKNINDRCPKWDYRIEGVPFYDNAFMDYSDGLYLFDNRNAQIYNAGATCAMWNVRPLTVHLVKKEGEHA